MTFDTRVAWNALAKDYEAARLASDSLDTLIEWPAQQNFIGEVTGTSILDVGCGSGKKLLTLLEGGAKSVLGLDISDDFISALNDAGLPAGAEFRQGDINDLHSVEAVQGRTFDLILCLQVLGYAEDLTSVFEEMNKLLTPDGRIVLCSSSPIRFLVERKEGVEFLGGSKVRYASGWNRDVVLEHSVSSISDRLNAVSAAGLYVARSEEPVFPADLKAAYPDKSEWWQRNGGIILWELRRRN